MLDAPIRDGLAKVDKLAPGSGFAELVAGARSAPGGFEGYARAEAGWKFAPTGSLYGFGEASVMPGLAPSWQAGLGARVTW